MQAVEVAIYRSYIEIYSPGNFPDHVSPEQFISEERKPIRRNPLITRTLYYSKDMESFATGLKRIYDTCTETSVKVDFLRDEYGFTVRFYRHCGEGWNISSNPDHDISEKGRKKGHEKGHETKTSEIEKRAESILALLKADSNISIPRMAGELENSEKQVRLGIDRLRSDGKIHYEGIGRGGHWVIDQREKD